MIKLNNKIWLGNQITTDEIQGWQKGSIITLRAGTGKGKSHFVKNNLYSLAVKEDKKILMLIHRLDCISQFEKEIIEDKKMDNVEIKSYQSLEYKLKNGIELDFSKYEYIVCDEFHYFMSDAAFNKTTDMSLNAILAETNKTRIFMSATGDFMKGYINRVKKIDTIDYQMDIEYDFINQLLFFNKDRSMEDIAEQIIKVNGKAIFFIQSAKKAYNLHKKYEDYTLFNCSKGNKQYYKYVDENKIGRMLVEERFEEQILITTTTMDAGVNIKDTDVQHIVCDVEDIGVLIQCIGRRRISKKIKNDSINLYIKNISNNQLGGRKTQINNKIERAKCFKKHGNIEYVKKYGRDPDSDAIVYEEVNEDETNTIKKLNEMAYYKAEIDLMNIDKMIAKKYKIFISELFAKDFKSIDEEYEKESLEKYLDSVVGEVMLMSKDRKEIIEKINVKSNGKQLKSLDSLNSALREQNLNFYINQFQTSRMVSGKKKNFKSAWRVLRLIDK